MVLYRISDQVTFRLGRLKGETGTVVDVRHEGHHIRVLLAGGRTVSTRPGAITPAPAGQLEHAPAEPFVWTRYDNGGWEGRDFDGAYADCDR